uniref:hypothetical protein n=1 Tax=Staphylococcus saprophyticus TaxID=29385 RepID=UPI0011A35CF8
MLMEGEKVIMMGQKGRDLDGIGGGMGVWGFGMMNKVDGYIVLNECDMDVRLGGVMDGVNEKG